MNKKIVLTVFLLFTVIIAALSQSISETNFNVSNGLPTSYDTPGKIIYPIGYSNYSTKTPVIFVHGISGKMSNSFDANIDQVKNYHLKSL